MMSSILLEKKQKVLSFAGPVVASVTPFDDRGEIHETSVLPYVEYLLNIGVKGAYVHGTTGEGVSLGIQEKKSLTKAWVDAVRKLKADLLLVINVSSSCLKDSLDHAKYCQELDVDGIAVLPPFYYRPSTANDLVQYLKHIAAGAPDLPLFFYHFPAMTGVDLNLSEVLSGVLQSVPSFTALKYTCKDIVDLNYLYINFGSKIKIFAGYEESLLAAFACGLDSSICAQFNFKEDVDGFKLIVESIKKGDLVTARSVQEKLTENARKLAKGQFIVNVKRELSKRVPLNVCVGSARPPVLSKY